jgi:GT2 family glycosyltransferase
VSTTPRASVIIPCLNAARWLPEQLVALAEQGSPPSLEVIVADNGSTDGTRELVDSYRDRLPRLRFVDASARRGQAYARNVGARAATSRKLLFVDADDVVAPDWVEALATALDRHGFVASRFDLAARNPAWVLQSRENPQGSGLNPYTYPPYLDHAGGSGLGVRREVHDAVGGFDETMPLLEDTDYCWRIQRAGTPLVFVPAAVVQVRLRHDLSGVFRQALSYGEHNVAIYKKFRPLGMPRLGLFPGLARWAKLLLSSPAWLSPTARPRVIWQWGWRLGRLRGCLKYRVMAP